MPKKVTAVKKSKSSSGKPSKGATIAIGIIPSLGPPGLGPKAGPGLSGGGMLPPRRRRRLPPGIGPGGPVGRGGRRLPPTRGY